MNKVILLCVMLLFLSACTMQRQAYEVKEAFTTQEQELEPIGIKSMKQSLPLDNFLSYSGQEVMDESHIWQDGIMINKLTKEYTKENHSMTVTITDTLGISSFTLGWDEREQKNTTSELIYKTTIHKQPAWIEYSKEFEQGYGEVLIHNRIIISVEGTYPTTAQDIEYFLNAVNIQYLDMIE